MGVACADCFETSCRRVSLPITGSSPSRRLCRRCVWRNYGRQPALIVLKSPVGASACPAQLFPQQTAVSSLRTAQLWPRPALTDLKPPAGGSASPYSLFPQQTAVSSLRTAQLWRPPALIVLNSPVGASACPRFVVSPAYGSVVAAYGATMAAACADRFETHLSARRPAHTIVVSPADGSVVAAYGATMGVAYADCFETSCRRVSLPRPVVSPAYGSVVAAYGATIGAACADRFETTCRRVSLPSPRCIPSRRQCRRCVWRNYGRCLR